MKKILLLLCLFSSIKMLGMEGRYHLEELESELESKNMLLQKVQIKANNIFQKSLALNLQLSRETDPQKKQKIENDLAALHGEATEAFQITKRLHEEIQKIKKEIKELS